MPASGHAGPPGRGFRLEELAAAIADRLFAALLAGDIPKLDVDDVRAAIVEDAADLGLTNRALERLEDLTLRAVVTKAGK
jgi:hypothetical protein